MTSPWFRYQFLLLQIWLILIFVRELLDDQAAKEQCTITQPIEIYHGLTESDLFEGRTIPPSLLSDMFDRDGMISRRNEMKR